MQLNPNFNIDEFINYQNSLNKIGSTGSLSVEEGKRAPITSEQILDEMLFAKADDLLFNWSADSAVVAMLYTAAHIEPTDFLVWSAPVNEVTFISSSDVPNDSNLRRHAIEATAIRIGAIRSGITNVLQGHHASYVMPFRARGNLVASKRIVISSQILREFPESDAYTRDVYLDLDNSTAIEFLLDHGRIACFLSDDYAHLMSINDSGFSERLLEGDTYTSENISKVLKEMICEQKKGAS